MLTFLYVLHFLVCFILIGVVLLQRGKGQDLGASLGGGGANTIFGSRGAGNFLTKMTTGSAIIFMITSLSLSYLGYKSSDARLFDESEPFVPEGAAPKAESGLEEIPAAAGAPEAGDEAGGLVEIPSADSSAAPDATADAPAGSAPTATDDSAAAPTAAADGSSPAAEAAPSPAASDAAPAAGSAPAGDATTSGTPAAEPAGGSAAPAGTGSGAEAAPSAAAPAPAADAAPAASAPKDAAAQP